MQRLTDLFITTRIQVGDSAIQLSKFSLAIITTAVTRPVRLHEPIRRLTRDRQAAAGVQAHRQAAAVRPVRAEATKII